jgi:ectoine hydroxylase-related dioxygenase (phytanoyl-CoA dioxygenase family)
MGPVESLERYGYAVIPSVLSEKECDYLAEALDLMEKEKRRANETEHLTDGQVVIYCVDLEKPQIFLPYIHLPAVAEVVAKILPAPYLLSSFAASRSGPKGGIRPHIDGRIPLRDVRDSTHISAVLCLDEYQDANGAICFWPMSHTSGLVPVAGMPPDRVPGKISCEAPRGSVLFFLGSTWHEIGVNRNGRRRWGIIATYCRWWVKPTYDYTRCGRDIYRLLSSEQKQLYGFTSIPPTYKEKRYKTVTRMEDLPEEYPEVRD